MSTGSALYLTVSQNGVWVGVGDVAVVTEGAIDVAVVTSEVGESNSPPAEVGVVVDGEHAARATAMVTATSVKVLTIFSVSGRIEVTPEAGRKGQRARGNGRNCLASLRWILGGDREHRHVSRSIDRCE